MVEILTSSGIFLDISPDAEFDIVIENPIFTDERVSAPWSTDIAFLPTLKNKRTFGYIGALMSSPSVTELSATIVVQGIHLVSGTLIFDGVSDGNLNYTFTSGDISSGWSKKLSELPFLGDSSDGISYMHEVLAGEIEGIAAPVIVNAALSADTDWNIDECNINRKYRNAADTAEPLDGFIPAITISRLISHAGMSPDICNDLQEMFGSLCVLGTMWTNYLPFTKVGSYSLNLIDSLPDISLKDFVAEVCKMCCAAVFIHRGQVHIVSFKSIVESGTPVVWDERVSDTFETECSEGVGYSLSYAGSTENAGTESIPEQEATALMNVFDYFDKTGAVPQYLSVTHKSSGVIFSVGFDRVTSPSDDKKLAGNYLSSKLSGFGKYETGAFADTEDVSIGLTPAPCAPVRFHISDATYLKMAPIVTIPGVGAARPSDAVVTLVVAGQGTDSGYVIGTDGDIDAGLRLDPASLFSRYHAAFADLKSKGMTTVTVDVDLTVYELAMLKVWSKISIYGKVYLISKLSVRMTAKTGGTLTVSCELVAL